MADFPRVMDLFECDAIEQSIIAQISMIAIIGDDTIHVILAILTSKAP
jgi:hypothetical protein